jgi:hypothetical protein
MTELFYHRYDGTAEIIFGQTGCTQGDSLRMQLFCLGLHTILCEAQLQEEHVRIFAIADDVTLVGPRAESLKVVEKLRELCAAGNLTIKKIVRLIGRDGEEIPCLAADPLSRLTAEHNIAYTCKPWDTGTVVGTTELIPDGMKIVGLPVGNAKFVNAHVNTKADEHAERLKHIKNARKEEPAPRRHHDALLLRNTPQLPAAMRTILGRTGALRPRIQGHPRDLADPR